jgi:hypothetical protein
LAEARKVVVYPSCDFFSSTPFSVLGNITVVLCCHCLASSLCPSSGGLNNMQKTGTILSPSHLLHHAGFPYYPESASRSVAAECDHMDTCVQKRQPYPGLRALTQPTRSIANTSIAPIALCVTVAKCPKVVGFRWVVNQGHLGTINIRNKIPHVLSGVQLKCTIGMCD